MTPFVYALAGLFMFMLTIVWICRLVMKPVEVNFDSGFSIADSTSRLSMLCMPFNSATGAGSAQWMFGSVTASKVTLECRTRGVRRAFSHFNGKFITDGERVVLKGKFEMSPGTTVSVVFWLTVLVPGLVFVAQKLVVDYSDGLLGLLGFICMMLVFILWVFRMRISDYPGDVKFISAHIESTLRAV